MTSLLPNSFLRRERGEGSAELLSLGSSSRMCGNGPKLHQGRLTLDIRNNFLANRVVKHRNRLPKEVVNVLSLTVFKRHLDSAFDYIL